MKKGLNWNVRHESSQTKKKLRNLLKQKNDATSWDKNKITQPLGTQKITQPLGTKKNHTTSWDKKMS